MNVNEAAEILRRQFPQKIITGYWVKGNGFVFNAHTFLSGGTSPGQYLVTNDGEIYGTNPIRSNLSPDDMKKF